MRGYVSGYMSETRILWIAGISLFVAFLFILDAIATGV